MIKYLELTAPEKSHFRQAKIISILVSEGDEILAGDAILKVMSGSNEVDLPARLSGKVIEVIVDEGENISLMTPLILLETVVEKSTATKPITEQIESRKNATADLAELKIAPKFDRPVSSNEAVTEARAPKRDTKTEKKAQITKAGKGQKADGENDAGGKEKHQQQSLNLDDSDKAETTNSDSKKVESGLENANKSKEHSSNEEQDEPAVSSQMRKTKITVPDIGIDSAKVIEILISVGDSVSVDDPIVTLESDKASMDVPSTVEGVIGSIEIDLDQDVSEGDLLIIVNSESSDEQTEEASSGDSNKAMEAAQVPPSEEAEEPSAKPSGGAKTVKVIIPDIGGDSAKVIEIFVEKGQSIDLEDPLVTLESDKASMDVPSTVAGTIESIEVKLDEEVSEGSLVATITSYDAGATEATHKSEGGVDGPSSETEGSDNGDHATAKAKAAPMPSATKATAPAVSEKTQSPNSKSHASPSVRRFARELGADLGSVNGTGRKGRITKDDVKAFIKGLLTSSVSVSTTENQGSGIPAVPAVDFSRFGEVDVQPLNKIKKLTAANLHRSWLNVPHVTHNDQSNISDLESFRKQLNSEYAKQGKDIKLSPLAFIVKAVVNALQTFPQFNSSLEPGGENLIYKKYFHIGIAVETPNGLVVPVVHNADTKSVAEIATEMGDLARKARDKKLTPADMSGSCFTISSLGGIGGTNFTPIVNAPEVAILGVSRSKMEPVWNGEEFEPGMMLPLSLSYDHRVIDGAEAARFTRQVAAVLEDVRRLAV